MPKLGPDLLSDEFTVEGGIARLAAYGAEHPEAEIAVVLLNQRVLAGLGNVYKSEVAFAAGVNPFRAMRTITEREREVMVEKSQQWMKANVMDGSSSTGGDQIVTYSGNRRTTGRMDREERLWVYGRQGHGVPAMRGDGDDAQAGGAGAVDVLVPGVPAVGGGGGADGGGTGRWGAWGRGGGRWGVSERLKTSEVSHSCRRSRFGNTG